MIATKTSDDVGAIVGTVTLLKCAVLICVVLSRVRCIACVGSVELNENNNNGNIVSKGGERIVIMILSEGGERRRSYPGLPPVGRCPDKISSDI